MSDNALEKLTKDQLIQRDANSFISRYRERLLMEEGDPEGGTNQSGAPGSGTPSTPNGQPAESAGEIDPILGTPPPDTPPVGEIDMGDINNYVPGSGDVTPAEAALIEQGKVPTRAEDFTMFGGEDFIDYEPMEPKPPGWDEYQEHRASQAAYHISRGEDMERVEAEWGNQPYNMDPGLMDPTGLLVDASMGFMTTPGRAALTQMTKSGTRWLGAKGLMRNVRNEIAFGAAATGFMGAAEQLGAGPIIQAITGLIGPTATYGLMQMSRRGMTEWLKNMATNRPEEYQKIVKEAAKHDDVLSDHISVFEKARNIEEKWAEEGVQMMVGEQPDMLFLNHIQVEGQGEGLGSKALQDLINYADLQQKPVKLTASPLGVPDDMAAYEASLTRLKSWYGEFGFKPDPDGETENSLIRMPLALTEREVPAQVTRRINDTLGFSKREAIDITKEFTPEDTVNAYAKTVPEIELAYKGVQSRQELRDEGLDRPDGHSFEFRWRPGRGGVTTFTVDSLNPRDIKAGIIDQIKHKVEFAKTLKARKAADVKTAKRELRDLEDEIKLAKDAGYDDDLVHLEAKRVELNERINSPEPPDNLFTNSLEMGAMRKALARAEGDLGIDSEAVRRTPNHQAIDEAVSHYDRPWTGHFYRAGELRTGGGEGRPHEGVFLSVDPDNASFYTGGTGAEPAHPVRSYQIEDLGNMKIVDYEENYADVYRRVGLDPDVDDLGKFADDAEIIEAAMKSYKDEGFDSVLVTNTPFQEGYGTNIELVVFDSSRIKGGEKFDFEKYGEDWLERAEEATRLRGEVAAAQTMNDLERPVDIVDRFMTTEVQPGVKRVHNIDMMKLDTTDSIKEAIVKTAETFKGSIDEARRDVIKWQETEKLADALGMTPQELLNRLQGQAYNAEELLAARKLLVSSAESLTAMSEKIATKTADEIDKFRFRRQLAVHYAIQAQVTGAIAEAGRALNAVKIQARSSKQQLAAIDDILRNMPDGVRIEDIAEAMTHIKTGRGINKYTRDLARVKTKDMFYEAWMNGLLSGPMTWTVNTVSNALVAGWMVPERLLASTFSKMAGDQSIAGVEAMYQVIGMFHGLKDGLMAFGRTIETNWDLARQGRFDEFKTVEPAVKDAGIQWNKMETNKQAISTSGLHELAPGSAKWLQKGGNLARVVDFMGAFIRTPGRILENTDALFKSIGYRMELQAQAYREAVGDAAGKNVSRKQVAEKVASILEDPAKKAPQIHAESVNAMSYQTFTAPLGERGQTLQKLINRTPGLRLVMPFVRTPTNILKFVGERTPFAIASKRIRDDIFGNDPVRKHQALAKITMGSAVMGMTAIAAMEGHITGRGPADDDMRRIKRNTGWQPYSIKIGDTYYAYGRIEPLGMLMGLAADVTEIIGQLDEVEADELAGAAVIAIANNTTSKTWLRGLSELLSTVNDPTRHGTRYIHNFLSTAIPTMSAQIERTLDPEVRAVYNLMDALKQKVPGWSEALPPRRNMWGEVIALEGGWGPDMISPIYTNSVKHSPIDEELLRLQANVAMPRKKIQTRGVEVDFFKIDPTGHLYDDYIRTMNEIKLNSTGLNLKDSLDRMVQSDPSYLSPDVSDDIKEAMILAKVYEARELAKYMMVETNSDIKAVVVLGQRKRELGQ